MNTDYSKLILDKLTARIEYLIRETGIRPPILDVTQEEYYHLLMVHGVERRYGPVGNISYMGVHIVSSLHMDLIPRVDRSEECAQLEDRCQLLERLVEEYESKEYVYISEESGNYTQFFDWSTASTSRSIEVEEMDYRDHLVCSAPELTTAGNLAACLIDHCGDIIVSELAEIHTPPIQCDHVFVEMGFMHSKMVCEKCDLEQSIEGE